MRPDIHPTYFTEAKVTCACGNSWVTGATVEELRVDICSACHPFYTGEQRIVDTEGQVDRFYKRLEARQKHTDEQTARDAEKTSPDRAVEELELGKRANGALEAAGIKDVGQMIAMLAEGGDAALLALAGFGRKSLADSKKNLRRLGYILPEDEE